MKGNDPTAIVNAIRRAAIMSPLDTTELAKATGFGREHMSKFRNHRVGMGLDGLCKLADFFGLEIRVVTKPQDDSK